MFSIARNVSPIIQLNKMRYLFLFLNILLCATGFSQNHLDTYIIASGVSGGNYYATGKYLASQCNSNLSYSAFSVIETNGSNENIHLLSENKVDFAIVQRNLLIESIYSGDAGMKNLVVIAPLFEEKLWIYCRGKNSIAVNSLDSVFSDRILRIGFTDKQGYTYEIFHEIVKLLDVRISEAVEIEESYEQLIEDFKNEEIDLLVSFSTPIQEIESLSDIQRVFLTNEDVLMLKNRMPNTFTTQIGDHPARLTLGSWSYFVGSKKSVQNIDGDLLSWILKSPIDSSKMKINELIRESYNSFRANENDEIDQLDNLPLYSYLEESLSISRFPWYFLVLLISIALLVIVLSVFIKRSSQAVYGMKYFWHRYRHFVFGFVLLLLVYYLSIEALLFSEEIFYNELGVKSSILNMTFTDLNSWLIITTVTGNSNGVFPLSLLGKAMLALNSLNFWIGTILIGTSEYLAFQINKKRKLGIMQTKKSNHLVIFGWNSTTEDFILETIHDAREYYRKKLSVVCVVNDIEEVRRSNHNIRQLQDQRDVDIIEGDALDSNAVELANVNQASSIILLSEEGNEAADERTVMRAHAIARFARTAHNGSNPRDKWKSIFGNRKEDMVNKQNLNYKKYKLNDQSDRVYIIAELKNEKYKNVLLDAGVNEVVVAGNYRKAVLKQSLFNHGISKVLDEILQYNEFNEFYKVNLSDPNNHHLIGKTYDELLVALRQQGLLLVGIQIIFHDHENNIVIDQREIDRLMYQEEAGVSKDMLINPTREVDKSRKVDGDDHLIVLATDYHSVVEGVSNVTF